MAGSFFHRCTKEENHCNGCTVMSFLSSLKNYNREFKKTTTATATALKKQRFNEQKNGRARTLLFLNISFAIPCKTTT